MDGDAILLTGVTGFLGAALALEALERRPNARLFCLVRGKEPARRLKRALRSAAAAYSREPNAIVDLEKRAVAIFGDLSKPGLGLKMADIEILRAARPQVWHCAASLADTIRDWPGLMATNVEGTRRLLDVAGAIGARSFNFVSTAYVAGRTHGHIMERRAFENPFNNHYELSKALAEMEVVDRCQRRGMAYRILRPSIVVPHAVRGTATGANGALGWILKLAMMREKFPALRGGAPLRYIGNGEGTLNTIPIDSVVADCVAIEAAGARSENRIFHLTNRCAPTMQWFTTRSAAQLGIELQVVGRERDLDPVSRRFHAATRFERPYVSGPNKNFSRDDSERTYRSEQSGECPLSELWLRRVIDAALAFHADIMAKEAAAS